MAWLRVFGQKKLQPILMQLVRTKAAAKAAERLLPLVTVEDCCDCPMLNHCLNACIGFRNLYMKVKGEC